jgi:hypothetical protein
MDENTEVVSAIYARIAAHMLGHIFQGRKKRLGCWLMNK